MLHSAFRGGESLAMKSNSIYFPKKRKSKKHLTTSLFLSKPYCLKGFSGGRCSAKRSLNTSPNTSLILFCIYSFPEHTTFRNLMKAKIREKSDLLSEVLSEVFGKHLTLWNPSKQRHFKQKSEVVRSFLKFSENNRTLDLTQTLLSAAWKRC